MNPTPLTTRRRASYRLLVFFLASLAGAGWTSCGEATADRPSLVIATTTSLRDSGLLDRLVPLFEDERKVHARVVAVGSGQAIELLSRGDAALGLTHSPAAEKEWLAGHPGAQRIGLFTGSFVIVGPKEDPAGIATLGASAALARVADQGATFVSRGDGSGTEARELQIWKAAERSPDFPTRLSAGAGMAEVLRIAGEKRAYTLSDLATFLVERDRCGLVILVRQDPLLTNPYSLLVPAGALESPAARAFSEFMQSEEALHIVAEFGRDRFDEPLFVVGG